MEEWLASGPPTTLVLKLLIASHNETAASPFDFEMMRYLRSQGWEPDLDIKKLARHPETMTRHFAYIKLSELDDRLVATQLLSQALATEKVARLRSDIERMLESLTFQN